ncbi:MAG: hypothetical protein P4L90_22365 [Rhodopila sp.]|nr:hypothetical protein [Rhodopila sp.]
MSAARIIIFIGIAALGVMAVGHALAQSEQYSTPLYTTQPSTLDKNYGLPTFGMPGADLPQQRTMAPETRTPPQPDFFKGSSDDKGLSDFTFPRKRPSTSADSGMETPLYTTTEGSTTGDTTSSDTPAER